MMERTVQMLIQDAVSAVVLAKGAINTLEIPNSPAIKALQTAACASPIMVKHFIQVGLAIW